MDTMSLFNLVFRETLVKWRDEYEKRPEDFFAKELKKCEKELTDGRDIKFCKLAQDFKLAVENYYDSMYYELCSNFLHTGFKLGMEFSEFCSAD